MLKIITIAIFFSNFLFSERQDFSKFNSVYEYLNKNDYFCYFAANLIDLFDMQNMQLHRISEPSDYTNI